MNSILLITIFTLTISVFNYLTYRRRRDTYIKAAKKWDGIVNELSNRK